MSTTKVSTSADYTLRDQERMGRAKRYFEWQFNLAEVHLGQRVLEIGCGVGNFTRHLVDRELVVGVDLEPACVARRQSSFSGCSNVVTLCADVLDPSFLELRKYNPDSVACLNVLEHVRDDTAALAHMHAVLPQGGKAVLIVPAFESLYGPIDERLGHYRRYSKQSMARVAEKAGFHPYVLRYINSIGFLGWWFNARALRKTKQSDFQIVVFDLLIVPVLSKMEAIVEPPFGQSILAVLVKPC